MGQSVPIVDDMYLVLAHRLHINLVNSDVGG